MISIVLKGTPEVTTLTRLCAFVNGKDVVHAMNVYVGVELQIHLFSKLVLDRDELLALLPGRFMPWRKCPLRQLIWGCLGSGKVLNNLKNNYTS